MSKKKGDLPKRIVLPHMRKQPNNPSEYVDVCGWQEHVEPMPFPMEAIPPQGELDLTIPNAEHNNSNGPGS
jgi:hypothetical protein